MLHTAIDLELLALQREVESAPKFREVARLLAAARTEYSKTLDAVAELEARDDSSADRHYVHPAIRLGPMSR